MSDNRWSSSRARVAAPLLLLVLVAAAAPAVAQEAPRDAHGLPLWETRVWSDFPVRIELESRDALTALLERVPIESFSREQVRLIREAGQERILLEPRVTVREAEALTAAGYPYERLRDREREAREEMEATWRRQVEEGGLRSELGARGVYHTYAQIGAILQQTENDYPLIADALSIGTSVQGRELWTIRISDNVGVEEAEPEVRLSGTMHGNEPPAQEMLLYLVDWLTSQYGIDPEVTELVDEYEIHILPCHNPDGLTAGIRNNVHNIDLNRNFPVPNGVIGDDGTWTEEPETVAFKSYGFDHDFVVSMNGHAGALVVNYPWDYTYSLTPDDAAIVALSLEYSTYNLPMYNSSSFPRGITNGAQWYVTKGCLQDWSYEETGCVDVTLELSNSHTPPASQLDALWNNNRQSFRHYILAARYGIHGVVTASDTGQPLDAKITVTGNGKAVFTDPDHGDFYKLLPTGTYELTASADGYLDKTVSNVSTVWGTPVVQNIQLDPDGTGVGTVARGSVVMLPNAPNPFRDQTTFRVRLASPQPLRLQIYDVAGGLVRTLPASATPGSNAIVWDRRDDSGRRVASGVYVVRLEGGNESAVRKAVVID